MKWRYCEDYIEIQDWLKHNPEVKIKLDKEKQYICEPTWYMRKRFKLKVKGLKKFPYNKRGIK